MSCQSNTQHTSAEVLKRKLEKFLTFSGMGGIVGKTPLGFLQAKRTGELAKSVQL